MNRLSIIIPMWNAERYIERCVNSCYRQGLAEEDFEILIANDGSTDGCVDIVKRLQSEHSNILLFSQENAGAGMARNLGLNHATGRYVMFVDSDDYLNPDTLKPILGLAEDNDLDLCRYDMRVINLDTSKQITDSDPVPKRIVLTGDELLGNVVIPFGSVCSSIYKLVFMNEHNLRFSGQTSSEDVAFNLLILPHTKRIMYSGICAYTYEIRTGSRRHSTDLKSHKRYMMNNVRNAALVKETALKNELISDSTRASLIKRANSMMAGEMLNQIRFRKLIKRDDIAEMMTLAETRDIYPIKGSTFSWKSNLLKLVLNNSWLYLHLFEK